MRLILISIPIQKKYIFKNFVIKHRHYNTSIIMAVQSFTGGINKALRKNVTAWFLWRQSDNDLHTIYHEVLSDIIDNESDFIKLFKKVTRENKHNFLLVDKDAVNDELVMRKGFNEIIIFNSDNYINNGKTSKNESEKITEEKKDA